jgi:hypothetical protein
MDAQKPHDGDVFLREWTIPEEDRAKYTTQLWAGEFRWFRSPNVICLEQYRRASKNGVAGWLSGEKAKRGSSTDNAQRASEIVPREIDE